MTSFAISRSLRIMEGLGDPTKGPRIRDNLKGQEEAQMSGRPEGSRVVGA